MWRVVLSLISAIIVFGAYIPYMRDILRGRARPARSTRVMFVGLLLIALLQQRALGSGWALAVTIGEAAGSLAILALSLKKGVGGLQRVDFICYGLLVVTLLVWLTTQNAVLALHLTVITDTIAFMPTLLKTWHEPDSETSLFYGIGAVAPILSMVAASEYTYGVLLFPAYLVLINALEVGLIYRPRFAIHTSK